jgi:prepilin-type N-terminal cleavage/methylation domain-containing protein
MAQKYTILKVLIQTSNKGFTLIELLVGLVITFIITGLAFDAFINSSNTFRNDQRNIDNSQNLSAILEIVGNDIQQSGEQITEATFPVVTIEKIPTTDTVNMPGSSKITVRRALASPLTLCADTTATTAITSLVVTQDSNSNANCKSGPVVKNEQILTGSTAGPLLPVVERPITLMTVRSYRCKLDNPTIDYNLYDPHTSTIKTDFCLTTKPTTDLEKIRAAMSDGSGNIWMFDYTDDAATVVDDTTTTPSTRKTTTASITISNMGTPPAVTYPVGTPIYLIEERIYTLDKDGNLNLQKDGGTAGTLIKGIQNFNVSAKVYTDTINKTLDSVSGAVAGSVLPAARRCESTIPNYICEFKSSTYPSDNWKTLAGIKVDLQAKYDGTGRNATPTDADLAKLSARAEFFPRNVLSK